MRLILVLLAIIIQASCAAKMVIPPKFLQKEKAELQITSPELSENYTIPLFHHKYINVTLYHDNNGCPVGEHGFLRKSVMSSATLTPSEYQQTFSIPASSDLYVKVESVFRRLGGATFCTQAFKFRPQESKKYRIILEPDKSFQIAISCEYTLDEVNDESGSGHYSKVRSMIPGTLALGGENWLGVRTQILGQNLCAQTVAKTKK